MGTLFFGMLFFSFIPFLVVLAVVGLSFRRSFSWATLGISLIPGAILGAVLLLGGEHFSWPDWVVVGLAFGIVAAGAILVGPRIGAGRWAASGLGLILGSHLAAACYNYDVINSTDGQAMFWAMHLMVLWCIVGVPVLLSIVVLALMQRAKR
ncbi:hypothetical protein QVA66_02530 [Staphylococcus chromogenes]|nr:hypothetical protein [Staphylococcus chromogenes]